MFRNQYLLLTTIALLGIPLGIFISRYTKEELPRGKKWFGILVLLSFISIMASLLRFKGDELALSLTSLAFLLLLSASSLFKAETLK